MVRGFTYDLGEQALNDRLAQARAHAVAAILKPAGYLVTRAEGKGKSGSATEDPLHREANRRAEVRADGGP